MTIRNPQAPLWLVALWVATLPLLLWNLMRAWSRYAETFRGKDERADSRHTHMWWPPRMSNFLILLGVGLSINDCLRHPPFGASRLSICAWASTIGLGYFCRNWDG